MSEAITSLPIAFAAERGHRLPHRRIDIVLDEANGAVGEGDIGTVAMIAAELSARSDIGRAVGDEAASRVPTRGGPGTLQLACLGQHQNRAGVILNTLGLEDAIVSKEASAAIFQGQVDRIGTNAGDAYVTRRRLGSRRQNGASRTVQKF